MDFAQDDVMTLLYPERRLIVVASDDAVEVVRRAESEDVEDKGVWDIAGFAALAVPGLGGAVAATAAAVAAAQLWNARKQADRAHLPFLVVTNSQAANLRFPNGHPLEDVVYVGDPGIAGNYYPVASFHRVLFEGKVAEAIRLLRSLGATEISIEYLEGFDRGAGVDLSVSPPGGAIGNIGVDVNATKKTTSRAKGSMKLSPTTPAHIPEDLIWFRSEPLWQEVADARLESGLRDFATEVNYTDDFGINADLKAKIASAGLGLGGTFTEFRETVWKLSGTFAE